MKPKCEICNERKPYGFIWIYFIQRFIPMCNECFINYMVQYFKWEEKDIYYYLNIFNTQTNERR